MLHANYTGLSFKIIRDIYQSDPGRLNVHPGRDRIVPVAVSLGPSNARIGNFVAVEALQLDIGALIAANTEREAGKAGEKYFSLRIEGKEYVLDVVEVVFDPVFRMQHVLAAIVNATTPDAYARFTFDPGSGSIAGTLEGGFQRYRIVSSDDRKVQLVFRLGSAQADAGVLVTSGKTVASSIAQVERRHAQAERIAEIKPDAFSLPRNGWSTRLRGGAIGKVDIARLGEPQVIAHLLKELSVFTRATGDEEFKIDAVSPDAPDNGSRTVEFHQLIGGIPVADSRSILRVGPEGDVTYLQTRVFDPSGLPTELIGKQEALRIATEVIEREVGHLGIVRINWMSDVGMQYVAKSTSQEEHAIELTPTWRVPAVVTTVNGRGIGESALVVINAATAEPSIQRNLSID